jgi:hypothetical protein
MAKSIGGYVGIGNPILAPDAVFASPSNTTSGDGAATFTFSAPDNEGLTSVTLFVIVAITGGVVVAAAAGTSSPITVTGLTNGTAHTFVIFAINDFGVGPGSFATDAVTPIAGRGLSFGGRNTPNQNMNNIEFVVIATTGNATDFGDLQAASWKATGFSSTTRGVMHESGSGYADVVSYVTVASAGNATDFGDRSAGIAASAGLSNNTRGLFTGGQTPDTSMIDVMDYFTIASTGDSTDFGNLTVARKWMGACASTTRGITSMGGNSPGGSEGSDVIDYVTISSTGNAADFGNLTAIMDSSSGGGASSSTRGVQGGGRRSGNSDVIEYITIASTGNAADFGNLLALQSEPGAAAASNKTRITYFGGTSHPAENALDVIQYITVATTGNATDFGDLGGDSGAVRKGNGALGNNHGGV